MMLRLLAAVAILAAASAAHAVTPAPNTMSVDDLINMTSAKGFRISPDGGLVVWEKTTPNKAKNGRITHIYLSRFDGSQTRQLTRGKASETSPRFSPDGTRVSFLAARGKDAPKQVWVLSLSGGEAEKLTRSQRGVRDYEWLDNDRLIYTADEDSSLYEMKLKEAKDDVIVVSDQAHYGPVRLFLYNVAKKKTERLSSNQGVIREFAVSPDGKWVVTSENQDIDYRYNDDNPPKQFLINLETRDRREICTDRYVDPYDFKWAADSKGFYARHYLASDSAKTFVAINELCYYDVAGERLARADYQWPHGLGRSYFPVDGGVLVALMEGVRDRIALAAGSGTELTLRMIETPQTVRLAAANNNSGGVIYWQSNASTIPEVMAASIGSGAFKDAHQLMQINESLRKLTLARSEVIRWAGARGDSVEGILYYPPQYEEGRAYPLIAWIHGGPSSRDWDFFTDRMSVYPHIMSARGAMILKVNYHGSDGYGLEWLESIKGRYYELEVPDILSGIDHVIAQGKANPDRLGIMGWSNGSILAIGTCIESDRFKVLCAGAGDVNWLSDYGNCAFGAGFDEAYFGGTPWDSTNVYIEKSPLFRMKQLKAPTLIMFGDKDTSVPTEQGWQHFRAMQRIGVAPVRFILFPGAGHGPTKLSHVRRKMTEELAWVDRYLFESYEAPNEAYDEESLLARELGRTDIRRVGSLYGDEVDAALVPELVAFEEIEVSRFEITNAQFAAFDPNYSYGPGADNHPVTGISIPLAETYCLWLAERTGGAYRLPTDKEMEALLKAAKPIRGSENHLVRWLGYDPSPDDVERIQPQIEALEATRSLVEVVGTFRPAGETGIYDIDGNVAEWVKDANGRGKIMGLSAVSPIDDAAPYRRPPMRYVGFRVVRK